MFSYEPLMFSYLGLAWSSSLLQVPPSLPKLLFCQPETPAIRHERESCFTERASCFTERGADRTRAFMQGVLAPEAPPAPAFGV